MGRKKSLIVGIIIGLLVSLGLQVYGADVVSKVTAHLRNDYHITLTGELQQLPEEYGVLIYNDRAYLPIRYVGELLDCKIQWLENTKTIDIQPPKDNTDSTVIDTTNSGKIPQSIETTDYRITAFYLGRDDDEKYRYRLYLRLENKTKDSVYRLDAGSAQYVIEGKIHGYNSIIGVLPDATWNTAYARPEESLEGYIRLPEAANNAENVRIKVNITKDGSGEPIPVEFNIPLNQ